MTTSTPNIQRILLPVDDSPGTQAAIDYAAVFATAMRAAITLVHVDVVPGAMVAIVPGASIEGDLAAARVKAVVQLSRIAAGLAVRGLTEVTTMVIESDDVAGAIVETSRTGLHDLIVMGTHARTGVSRLVLGSIAEEVLRHAPCPVVTVHLPPDR